jgi:hypothetical protein
VEDVTRSGAPSFGLRRSARHHAAATRAGKT